MRRLFLLCGVLICVTAIAPLMFGANAGASLPDNLYDEILRHVQNNALVAPKNPEACALALYEWKNAEEICGDAYAKRFSAAEVALMDREENAPVFEEMRGRIGIIRFNAFGKDTYDNLMKQALVLLEQHGAEELRLDLRDNGGGSMETALKILYLFAGEHDRFATFQYRTKTEIYDAASVRTEFKLLSPGALRNIPTTVWINGESASASEMVAGAMQDWGYFIHGMVSYKKGVGQDFFGLSDGSFIRLITFEFFVGNSQTKIHGIGVIPNAPLPDKIREQ